MTPDPSSPDARAARHLFPGRSLPVADGRALATVYPLGLVHLKRFGAQIATALQLLAAVPLPRDPDPAEYEGDPGRQALALADYEARRREYGQALLRRLGPFLLDQALDLVRDCVVLEAAEQGAPAPTWEQLPHWDFPAIAEAFVAESFDEERKWRPWLEALEGAVTKVTGKPFSISEITSSSSSAPATP